MLDTFFFLKHLETDEKLLLIVHRYWGKAMNSLLTPSILLLCGWGILIAAPVQLVWILVGSSTLLCGVWWLHRFMDYYLDVWLITNHGVIDLQWKGWFHRQSTRILYSDIEGVKYEIKGIANTLMRTGTISLEKVSTGSSITLSDVQKPRGVQMFILKQMEDYMHTKNLKNAKHVQDLLSEFVAEKMQYDLLPANVKDEPKKKQKGMTTRPV